MFIRSGVRSIAVMLRSIAVMFRDGIIVKPWSTVLWPWKHHEYHDLIRFIAPWWFGMIRGDSWQRRDNAVNVGLYH